MKYSWESGYAVFNTNVPAQAVGVHIEKLREEYGNLLTPRIFVDSIEDARLTVHPLVEWNDTKAGDDWRLHQARNALNAVRIVFQVQGEEDRHIIANVHVIEDKQHGYMPIEAIVNDADLHAQVVAEAQRYIAQFERRIERLNLKELEPIMQAIRATRSVLAEA